MVFDKATYEKLAGPIRRASKSILAEWPDLLDPSEIESELYVEVLQSPKTTDFLVNAPADEQRKVLYYMADRICAKERSRYEHFSGQYHYSVAEAIKLAEDILGEPLDEYECPSVSASNTADFSWALKQLQTDYPEYAELFTQRYVYGVSFGNSSDRGRLSHARARFTDFMNMNRRQREAMHAQGPGTRPRIPGGYDPYEGDWDSEFTLHAQGGHSASG